MSEEAKRYEGWANYETWCVHLWMTNEEGTYRYWREEAAKHRKEFLDDATEHLAEKMGSEIGEASPLQSASLFSDLLSGALSEVDWRAVADAFLEDVQPSEDDQAEEDEDEEDNHLEGESRETFEEKKRERIENQKEPLFELGQVVSTPEALSVLSREVIETALARHHRGDWGEVGRHDWRENETSLREGFRILSVYRAARGTTFWVITEADRSSTCVLLPSEY